MKILSHWTMDKHIEFLRSLFGVSPKMMYILSLSFLICQLYVKQARNGELSLDKPGD